MTDEPQSLRHTPGGEVRPPSPFKFLDPYGPEDDALFFGRASETAVLYTRLYSGPVTVVYGESGTGKTSLIQCGLRNRVPAEDMLFVSVRTALEPETTLRQELQKLVAPAEGALEDLDALLRRAIRRSYKTLVLVFDQFEEFFLFQSEDVRRAFGRRLSGWLEEGVNLRLVFAVREEYLARLTELEDNLPGLYENRLWLRRMSREQAQEAIAAPCRIAGVAIETGLVTALLDTLGAGGQGVELPILQIVLDTLFRQTAQAAGTAPGLTLQAYRDLGEVHRILARFVDDRLAAYGEDAEIARTVLKTVITAEGTRRLAAPAEIAERLSAFGIELAAETLIPLLQRLVDDRILREDPERHLFELRHDALAAHIRQWMSAFEQELVDVRQTIENRLREYRQRGRLLEADVLTDLAPYEVRLRLQGELAELVDRSKRDVKRRRQRLRWAGAGIVAVVLAFGVFSFIQWREAARQKTEAEANFERARQAVDAFFTEVSESALLNQPKLEPLRRKLLEKALRFYEDLSSQRAEDPEIQEELGAAAFRVGMIKQLLGDSKGAEDAYRKALDIYERLAREHPEVPEYQSNLAMSYHNLGVLQMNTPREAEAAVVSLQKAIDLRERLAPEHPEVPEYRSGLARTLGNLSYAELFVGHPRAAIAAAQRGLETDRSQVWIRTKLAHGYLLDNQYAKALAIYTEQQRQNLRRSADHHALVVLQDFMELRASGIAHPDMDKIERLLRAGRSERRR